eukprot:GHVR01016992.1.p1 GENE.GHVR01016992.1~~GHVR01016992.1.p1  ORF type:complete len:530 (+),score=134.39 GHVR01016992.1:231-1592(+)
MSQKPPNDTNDTNIPNIPNNPNNINNNINNTSTIMEYDHIFIFVNPNSGGNAAGTFTRAGVEVLTMTKTDTPLQIHVFDITEGNRGDKHGFKILKQHVHDYVLTDRNILIKCLAAGGDGTVLWLLSELDAHDISDERVVVGVIPYGTGNDFGRALNWISSKTTKAFDKELGDLKALISRWCSADVVEFDVWEVCVSVHDRGCMKKIDGKSRCKVVVKDSNDHPVKFKKTPFLNYFSFGVDSKIGIGFDRRRKKTAFGNKMVYLTEGMKKICCHKIDKLTELVESFEAIDGGGSHTIVAAPKKSKDKTQTEPVFIGSPVSLVAINIPSFAGGCDIWKCCGGKLGVRLPPQAPKETIDTLNTLKKAEMCMGDSKLEFLTFPSTSAMGMEQVFKGRAMRLHQGGGPWVVNFKSDLHDKRVYMQIDGEFFQLEHPDKVEITHRKTIKVIKAKQNNKL